MTRDQALKMWREVCGSDTVMACGIVTGRMLEEFAARIEAAERERWERDTISTLAQGGVLVRLHRHEGYEDVHPQLVAEDAIGDRWPRYDTLEA